MLIDKAHLLLCLKVYWKKIDPSLDLRETNILEMYTTRQYFHTTTPEITYFCQAGITSSQCETSELEL